MDGLPISHVTREGYEKIKNDLNYLIKVKRKEIAEALDHARSLGDLRENAEYEAAKQAQAMNENRIKELSNKIATSSILDDSNIPDDKVYFGATVKLKDVDNGEEMSYKLVSDAEADFLEDKISVTSPIGKGLLGHEVGEVVTIQVPAGILNYEVLDIKR